MNARGGDAAESGIARNLGGAWQALWSKYPEAAPAGVAVVLHGGPEESVRKPAAADPGRVRMALFAREVRRLAAGREIAVIQPRYAVRGWNGAARSPVAGVEELLDTISAKYGPVPVALVGHSMGGRIAATLAARPEVAVVVGLAPWWPDDEGRFLRPGQKVLVLHGRNDRVVDPGSSRRQVEAAVRRGVDAEWLSMPGGHGMLRDLAGWHRMTARFVVSGLLGAGGQS